jgi:hypothetical protein
MRDAEMETRAVGVNAGIGGSHVQSGAGGIGQGQVEARGCIREGADIADGGDGHHSGRGIALGSAGSVSGRAASSVGETEMEHGHGRE